MNQEAFIYSILASGTLIGLLASVAILAPVLEKAQGYIGGAFAFYSIAVLGFGMAIGLLLKTDPAHVSPSKSRPVPPKEKRGGI